MSSRFTLEKTFRNKHVLITGGLGFIGSNLARALVRLGARVTILDSLIPEYGGNRRNLRGIERDVSVHRIDVREHGRLPRVLRGEKVLVAAHGNSLRSLVMVLDKLTKEQILGVNLATGVPMVYKLNADSTVASKEVLGDMSGAH